MNAKIESYIRDAFKSNPEVVSNPTCYIYDLETISDEINEIERYKLDNVSLYYAMKANPNSEVLSHILKADVVKGIEIASIGELEKAIDVGLEDTSRVLFTGPGKTPYELREALRRHIRFINVESVVEAIRLNEIAKEEGLTNVPILLRVNINYFIDGVYEHMAGASTKLGMDECRFFEDYKIIRKLHNLNVCGLHVFAADGVLDYKVLLKYADYVFRFVKKAEEIMGDIGVIDFGGGIGIDYTKSNQRFDTKSYFEGLKELVTEFGFENKEIILELGKVIVGRAGYYVTKIIDIKDCKGEKHIVTAGGVNHMRLPIASGRKHPVYIIPMGEEKLYEGQPVVENENVDIEGPLCMTEDKISWDEPIEKANIGDIVVLTQAGAYCYSASTLWFLSHQLPLELIVE